MIVHLGFVGFFRFMWWVVVFRCAPPADCGRVGGVSLAVGAVSVAVLGRLPCAPGAPRVLGLGVAQRPSGLPTGVVRSIVGVLLGGVPVFSVFSVAHAFLRNSRPFIVEATYGISRRTAEGDTGVSTLDISRSPILDLGGTAADAAGADGTLEDANAELVTACDSGFQSAAGTLGAVGLVDAAFCKWIPLGEVAFSLDVDKERNCSRLITLLPMLLAAYNGL